MMFNSVVKESCFKHQQDIIAMFDCDVTFTVSLCHNQPCPSISFCFKVKAKKL